jgi:hypothetical protein
MVAWMQGPLILENRRHVDPSGFIIEFDASIWVNLTKNVMKAKLRLDNVRQDRFLPGVAYQVIATVAVSAGSSHALHVLMDPQFARLDPNLSDQVLETILTTEGEKFILFGDIVSVRHILQSIRVLYTE